MKLRNRCYIVTYYYFLFNLIDIHLWLNISPIIKNRPMKFIYALSIVALLATSCSKTTDTPEDPIDQVTKKEDPSIPVPKATITVISSGDQRTVTITGSFFNLYFDQIYYKADGTLPGDKEPIRTAYTLKYDAVVLFSNGKQPFTFSRTGAYTYTLTHTISKVDHEKNSINLIGNNVDITKDY